MTYETKHSGLGFLCLDVFDEKSCRVCGVWMTIGAGGIGAGEGDDEFSSRSEVRLIWLWEIYVEIGR
jgi:hypothetical protein